MSAREALRPLLWGPAGGVMAVASVAGLIAPALEEGSAGEVGAGIAAGVAFLALGRVALRDRDVHVGALRGGSVRTAAGVMLALVALDLIPESLRDGGRRRAATGFVTAPP